GSTMECLMELAFQNTMVETYHLWPSCSSWQKPLQKSFFLRKEKNLIAKNLCRKLRRSFRTQDSKKFFHYWKILHSRLLQRYKKPKHHNSQDLHEEQIHHFLPHLHRLLPNRQEFWKILLL